jgi:hypothetical protein
MALDGKTPVKNTAFDAHEKVVRGPHTYSRSTGYLQAKEAVAETAPEPKPESEKEKE